MADPLPTDQLDRLRRAGLSRYESLVYLGLVLDRNARVVEVARRTGVPQPKVYQALDSLVEKGFCAIGADAVNRYRPIEPVLALEARARGLAQERAEVEGLAAELQEVYASGKGEDRWAPPVEIVKGVAQIQTLLVEQVRKAREELLYFGQAPQVSSRELTQTIWDRAQGGLRVRMVFERGYFEDGAARGEEDDLMRDVKGEKRWVDSLPSKMIVVDGSTAMMAVSKPDSAGFLLLVLRQKGLVGHCLASFEHVWGRARA
jgi:sugar-specific transcriptional regulator TrmB